MTDLNNLPLSDYLSVERTLMAAERTLLAYVRTFLGILAGGTALINFIDSALLIVIGYVLIVIAPFICIFGVYRFQKIKRNIKNMSDRSMLK